MAAQGGIVLLFFYAFELSLLVSGAHVAGRRLAFFLSFGTFEYDIFSGHKGILQFYKART